MLDAGGRPMRHRLTHLLAAAVLAACSFPDPADFDQSCEVPDDCAVVRHEVSNCGCDCPHWDAVHVDELEDFENAFDAGSHFQVCLAFCDLGCIPVDRSQVTVTCEQQTCGTSVTWDDSGG